MRFHFSRSELLKRHTAGLATPQPVEVNALIDTGAEASCADMSVINRINLPPYRFGFTNAPAIGGFQTSTSYDTSLTIIHPDGTSNNDLVLPEFSVIGLSLGTLGYDAVLGRDVLASCILIYDGTANTFSLSF